MKKRRTSTAQPLQQQARLNKTLLPYINTIYHIPVPGILVPFGSYIFIYTLEVYIVTPLVHMYCGAFTPSGWTRTLLLFFLALLCSWIPPRPACPTFSGNPVNAPTLRPLDLYLSLVYLLRPPPSSPPSQHQRKPRQRSDV